MPTQEFPALIATIYTSISQLISKASIQDGASEFQQKIMFDEIRKSIAPDAMISSIYGKAYKMLKRHISGHGLMPESYR